MIVMVAICPAVKGDTLKRHFCTPYLLFLVYFQAYKPCLLLQKSTVQLTGYYQVAD